MASSHHYWTQQKKTLVLAPPGFNNNSLKCYDLIVLYSYIIIFFINF